MPERSTASLLPSASPSRQFRRSGAACNQVQDPTPLAHAGLWPRRWASTFAFPRRWSIAGLGDADRRLTTHPRKSAPPHRALRSVAYARSQHGAWAKISAEAARRTTDIKALVPRLVVFNMREGSSAAGGSRQSGEADAVINMGVSILRVMAAASPRLRKPRRTPRRSLGMEREAARLGVEKGIVDPARQPRRFRSAKTGAHGVICGGPGTTCALAPCSTPSCGGVMASPALASDNPSEVKMVRSQRNSRQDLSVCPLVDMIVFL